MKSVTTKKVTKSTSKTTKPGEAEKKKRVRERNQYL